MPHSDHIARMMAQKESTHDLWEEIQSAVLILENDFDDPTAVLHRGALRAFAAKGGELLHRAKTDPIAAVLLPKLAQLAQTVNIPLSAAYGL